MYASKKGTSWRQLIAQQGSSTPAYKDLFKTSVATVTDITRANKALVHGGSDSIAPKPDTWHSKTYTQGAMVASILLRVNEPFTALSPKSMGTQYDMGTGIMAEVLQRKWSAKSSGQTLHPEELLGDLRKKYPQLTSVQAMRDKYTVKDIWSGQIDHDKSASKMKVDVDSSILNAAVEAGRRRISKTGGVADIGEYVQLKFKKHGLGQVPGGWAEELRKQY